MEIDLRYKLLRLEEVLDLLKMSRSSWYKGIAEGRFPKPRKINPRTSVWLWTEIEPLIPKLGQIVQPQPFFHNRRKPKLIGRRGPSTRV